MIDDVIRTRPFELALLMQRVLLFHTLIFHRFQFVVTDSR